MQTNVKIDFIIDQFANFGADYLFDYKEKVNIKISDRLREAAKQRIHVLIEKREALPYGKDFTKMENKIIYLLVKKTLLYLSLNH